MKKYYEKIQNFIREILKDKLKAFRIFMVIFMVDIIIIFIMARINPLDFLNVVKFLSIPSEDARSEMFLYFPRITREKKGDVGSEMEELIIKVPGKVVQRNETQIPVEDDRVLFNARKILETLSTDPASVHGKMVFNYANYIKSTWKYEDKLIVQFHEKNMTSFSEEEITVLKECITRSLQENITSIKQIDIIID